MGRLRFKCVVCGSKCRIDLKQSKLKGRGIKEKVFVYRCEGRNMKKPHSPITFVYEPLEVEYEKVKRVKVGSLMVVPRYDVYSAWERWMLSLATGLKPKRSLKQSKKVKYDSGITEIREEE